MTPEQAEHLGSIRKSIENVKGNVTIHSSEIRFLLDLLQGVSGTDCPEGEDGPTNEDENL